MLCSGLSTMEESELNMGEFEDGIIQDVIAYVRARHAKEIEAAYEHFWEEDSPEEFLQGTALDVGFMNFEDWLIFDYAGPGGETFVERYLKDNEVPEEVAKVLGRMGGSLLSLYEVKSPLPEIVLTDLLLGEEITLSANLPGLKLGDVFATRVFKLEGGENVMAKCVYPFGHTHKDAALEGVQVQFKRYQKNEQPGGTMREFLGKYSESINTVWMSNLYKFGK